MSVKAHTQYDVLRRAVSVVIADGAEGAFSWEAGRFVVVAPGVEAPAECVVHLPGDAALALYDALAEHFGHTGHDMRALRKDYDHERSRVDKLVDHLIEQSGQ